MSSVIVDVNKNVPYNHVKSLIGIQEIAVSQVDTCDGQVYTVNYSNTQAGTQTNLLPLFED